MTRTYHIQSGKSSERFTPVYCGETAVSILDTVSVRAWGLNPEKLCPACLEAADAPRK